MNKKKPIRSCFITKKRYYKEDLIRLYKNSKNIYELDMQCVKGGRGLYFNCNVNLQKFCNILSKKKIKLTQESYKKLENILRF